MVCPECPGVVENVRYWGEMQRKWYLNLTELNAKGGFVFYARNSVVTDVWDLLVDG